MGIAIESEVRGPKSEVARERKIRDIGLSGPRTSDFGLTINVTQLKRNE